MKAEEVILRATDGQLTWIQAAEILGRSPPVESSEWRSDTSRLPGWNQHGTIWPHPTACYTAVDV